ncbi:glucose-6-phosphate 1-dehydrogenase [Striga asiatica]|uniref:Glucose-6-phosphate 1-dehydrogenase n=1 Tax=Striga asiatica TaxID=4170 RepID=A0A5A7R8K4_STRAF|nr:glucose-6-phosphate 1-dehydrogenase [Striga asiatica]
MRSSNRLLRHQKARWWAISRASRKKEKVTKVLKVAERTGSVEIPNPHDVSRHILNATQIPNDGMKFEDGEIGQAQNLQWAAAFMAVAVGSIMHGINEALHLKDQLDANKANQICRDHMKVLKMQLESIKDEYKKVFHDVRTATVEGAHLKANSDGAPYESQLATMVKGREDKMRTHAEAVQH